MNILLLGATGVVGQQILAQALHHPRVTQVFTPVRKLMPMKHDKLQQFQLDFGHIEAQLPTQINLKEIDAVLCALGTTMKQAGSKDAFRKVDHDYPLTFAEIAKQNHISTYVLNSAMGANADSMFFYNQVKGELEQALKDLHFPSLTLVRPGLIDGNRDEFRLGEKLALNVLRPLNELLPKSWRLSPAQNIAKALLQSALEQKLGTHIISADALAE
ncbi:MAG: NAD(P)H-binding protein [Pseudomonadota bacterium]|nr:NAD(P)H-binding protein [Pseudomonadota bacterium]